MNYLDKEVVKEALFVGIYTWFLYLFISQIISIQKYPEYFFFILGFTKHFLGDFVQLHTYFCNYGYACKYYFNPSNIFYRVSQRKEFVIMIESILEGLLFLFVYFLFSTIFRKNINWITIFCIGFLLHLCFEYMGIHRFFCKYRCSSSLDKSTE